MTAAEAPALAYSSAPGRWVLTVTVLGSRISALDATVVSIALPTIGRDFGTGVAALQWVMNGYTLTLAAFLLTGGSLGDRFGKRKVDRSIDARSDGHVLGPGVLATGKRLVAPTGSSPYAMTAAVTAPKADSR